jgi:hypothetical protein
MLATRTKPATAPGDLRPRDDGVAVPERYGETTQLRPEVPYRAWQLLIAPKPLGSVVRRT